MLVLELVGDKSTAALLTMHEPFVLKQLDRLPDGDACDLEFPFKPFKSGNLLSRLPLAVFDALPQRGRNLNVVSRTVSTGVSGFQFRHAGYSIRKNDVINCSDQAQTIRRIRSTR